QVEAAPWTTEHTFGYGKGRWNYRSPNSSRTSGGRSPCSSRARRRSPVRRRLSFSSSSRLRWTRFDGCAQFAPPETPVPARRAERRQHPARPPPPRGSRSDVEKTSNLARRQDFRVVVPGIESENRTDRRPLGGHAAWCLGVRLTLYSFSEGAADLGEFYRRKSQG